MNGSKSDMENQNDGSHAASSSKSSSRKKSSSESWARSANNETPMMDTKFFTKVGNINTSPSNDNTSPNDNKQSSENKPGSSIGIAFTSPIKHEATNKFAESDTKKQILDSVEAASTFDELKNPITTLTHRTYRGFKDVNDRLDSMSTVLATLSREMKEVKEEMKEVKDEISEIKESLKNMSQRFDAVFGKHHDNDISKAYEDGICQLMASIHERNFMTCRIRISGDNHQFDVLSPPDKNNQNVIVGECKIAVIDESEVTEVIDQTKGKRDAVKEYYKTEDVDAYIFVMRIDPHIKILLIKEVTNANIYFREGTCFEK